MPQAYIPTCPEIVALCVCIMRMLQLIKLHVTAFCQRLSKWIVGACYLSACGKYLQLSMYGAELPGWSHNLHDSCL